MKFRPKNKTGRTVHGAQDVRIPHYVLHSPAFRALSPASAKTLLYILKLYNGLNNGHIAFGVRTGSFGRENSKPVWLSFGLSKSAVAEALKELEERGFLVCTKLSSFGQKKLVKEWRITWLPGPGPTIPTKDFFKVQGKARKRGPRPK